MLTLSKVIEPGDWLTFFGTLVGALIGSLIAGGIAIYVAHRQNKQQNDYIEKQNELDERVKEYELLYKHIVKLNDDINQKQDKLIYTLNNLALETDSLKRYQYLLNISYDIGYLNNTTKVKVESIKDIMNKMNASTSLLDANTYMSKLQSAREYTNNETETDINITDESVEILSEKINEIGNAKNIFVENLYKSLSQQLKQTYK
ncbi:hypothetical protein ACMVYK_02450 [Staphylococcus epidermidis]|jgi:hypothetical protein|uniref:hypothetical protein n=1 Tax=Bacillati TaxID=1783272 RepID=UPI00026C0265|nr:MULTISPECIES: hypothetical protein [Staphylococcus]DAK09344.1 MAG TPA: Cell-membrane associated Mucin15 [Caudoviricetes sp.]EJE17727.1 hypothetical protein HMPREF9979_00329 [Staphylococcus epidermidis NIHLM018]MCH9546937.1 hypothetical protein [Staphylococcus epidermidis]MCH9567627.1 hypothetical protein [Staphylococcus epidermidis]MCO6201549.1 hypothetical protein [Staphylococcus epidermidis]